MEELKDRHVATDAELNNAAQGEENVRRGAAETQGRHAQGTTR